MPENRRGDRSSRVSSRVTTRLAGRVTVIVATRNERHNIAGFLHSIPDDLDLIVVDDSDDDTKRVIRRLRPDRTRVFAGSGTIAAARHLGAELAQTPWLLFTDADVAFAPGYFERVFPWLLRDLDAIYGPKLALSGRFASYYRWFGHGQHLADRLGIPAVSGSNFLVRRSTYARIGGFDPGLRCNEDSELGWRLARQGCHVAYAPDLVVLARDHRRLERGVLRKTLHTLVRGTLLYANLMPRRLRESAWGYWSAGAGIRD